ncbi:sugar O-acetyltransferase [Vibrio mimicus]|uniref:sugar O-acetyltransferase n=1 Tax=Vibrio mimicus TaxID=674 RepID=UPI0011D3A4C4|nr:sugar O-acetyltransferase [Vibrio mimicus]TXZ06298.1 sugar O-acetyltransferase [Vibrio mimicus]
MSRDLKDFSVQLPIKRDLIIYQTEVKEKLYDFNHTRPAQHAERQVILNSILGAANGVTIVPPFFCDLGHNIHFKCGGFLNTNVTILDIAPVTIGEYVQMGPNVVISTVGHPLDLAQRVLPIAAGNPIVIEDNVWLGAGAIVLDGVTIGARSVVGAGSVVTRDIPPDCVAVGNPCRVIRQIEHSEMPSEAELDEMWRDLDFIESEK